MARPDIRRHSIIPRLFAIILLAVAYVLSYAPVVKFKQSSTTGTPAASLGLPTDGSILPFYRPVDYLIDETPLRSPLFLWADLWSARYELEVAATLRSLSKDNGDAL